MPSSKISNMPAASSVTDADVTAIVQGGANKKATFAVILAYISAALSAVSTFLGLSDTPSSYAGEANKVVSVKADESGLEFTPPGAGGGAPDDAHYLTTQSESGLSAEFNLGGLASGLLKQAVAAGVATPAIATEGSDYLGPARIDDTAYDPTTWNGDTTHAPSKNAVRDKFESLSSGAPDSAHYLTTQSEAALSAEFNLGGLASGLLKQAVAGGVATPAIATEGSDYLGPARIDDTAYDPTAWNGDTTHAPSKNAVRDKFESLPTSTFDARGNFTFGLKRSAGISVGKLPGYWTADFTGTISAWNITVDAGTITLKVWKIAAGTAHPTAADSINSSGISLSSNTNIHSADVSDFTTLAVTYGDIFALEVTAVSGVTDFGGSVEINKA